MTASATATRVRTLSTIGMTIRFMALAAAAFWSVAAVAQDKPPMVGDRPLLQVKPHAAAVKRGARPKSIAAQLQACLDIEDGTKGRLDCYDAVFKPQPKPKTTPAKKVADCRFVKEEDERLTCFNGFAETIPKLPANH